MIRLRQCVALGAALLLLSGPAVFASDEPDELMSGRTAILRTGLLMKFVAKPPTGGSFDLPDAANDPRTEGGTLTVFDTGEPDTDVYALPSTGWKGLGSPSGNSGYKYKGLGSSFDPCKVVLVKAKVVKAVCRGAGIQVTPPLAGDLGIVLAVGTDTKTYCAQLGGDDTKNVITLFKRRNAPEPIVCPTPVPEPGSTTSTSVTSTTSNTGGSITTTSTTSTTSSTSGGPCCGGLNFASYTNGVAAGNCGNFVQVTGAPFDTLDCGGLYFGGGGNAVPLPAITPDLAQQIVEITSCTGQTATLGPSTSTQTGTLLNCSSPGCAFGGPLPIPNTASTPTSTCVINTVSTAASGNLNCDAGTAQINLPLASALFLVGDGEPGTPGIQPCPICSGGTPFVAGSGTCQSGPNNGMACMPLNTNQGSLTEYPTSLECPPDPMLSIGTLPIAFALDSGTISWTATTSTNDTEVQPNQARVFCGYCRDSDVSLSFKNPFQQCWENGMAVGAACSGSFETCEQRTQGAFGPGGGGNMTINAIGNPAGPIGDGLPHAQQLVSVFCIPPTFNATIDATANLPGAGAVGFNGQIELCAGANPCP